MKIYGLSAVWGDKYINRFLKGCATSMGFNKNKEAMKNVTWNIFTDEEAFDLIEAALHKIVPDTNIVLRDLSVIRGRIDYLHAALMWQIDQCLKEKARMLLIQSDSIFGNGTLDNIFQMGRQEKTCVVVPHPRVKPAIIFEPMETNAQLVTAAWKHLHRSWLDAEDGCERQNSYVSGVTWRKAGDNIYQIKHMLPTPYFCDFTEEDRNFFDRSPGFGDIDWVWPGHLVQQGRMIYCTSSDACFIAEISDDDNHAPTLRDQPKDGFFKNFPHNHVNKMITAFFRGE